MSIKDKTIIITGASDGIGKAVASNLCALGARVVIVGRSAEKTKAVAKNLGVPYYICDFMRLEEVRDLGKNLLKSFHDIDVLINNAGGIFGKRELTEDGYEKTMQVNHLAHFALTNILLPTLITNKATVINVSSVANKVLSNLDINDINMENAYSPNSAYGNAKLENILFTKELSKRYDSQGLSAVAVHPGNVATNFASESNSLLRFIYQTPLKRLVRLITPDEGADTIVWLAKGTAGKDWQSGGYYVNRKITEPHPLANDSSVARSLWEQSEKMIQT